MEHATWCRVSEGGCTCGLVAPPCEACATLRADLDAERAKGLALVTAIGELRAQSACSLHPQTMLRYGCAACADKITDALTAEIATLRAALGEREAEVAGMRAEGAETMDIVSRTVAALTTERDALAAEVAGLREERVLFCPEGHAVAPDGTDEPTCGACTERDAALTRCRALEEGLEFYADPATYFAIGFLPDPPCGDLMDDFDDTELGWKPGKRARALLAPSADGKGERG